MRADENKRIDKSEQGIDRRTFVKRGLLGGGALIGGGLAISKLADAGDGSASSPGSPPPLAAESAQRTASSQRALRPNILVIVVDQLRYPQWLGAGPGELELPPNMQRLREGAVSFAHHYTASNDCTPARAALLTGLYTHQTGCMITGASTLNPGFPTWGSMLREHGYHTRWYGKWHLTHGDNKWTPERGERALERYGFAGGTYPSPDGAPGQGWRVDPGDRRAVRAVALDRRRGERAVVHDGVVRQPARHRLVVQLERSASAPRRARRAWPPSCRPTSRPPNS